MASNVDLTPDEQAKVSSNRRAPRPRYFDATAQAEQEISPDFEAFLILQDAATITATLTQIATAGLLAEIRMDRDAVAFEALVADIGDRSTKQSEIEGTTAIFNEWKDLFRAGKFNDVSEVGLLIQDIQATGEEMFVTEERLKHLEMVHNRVKERIRQGVSTAQLQQLQSWPTPLLAY